MSAPTHSRDLEVERLFRSFRAGDRAALTELVARTTPWLNAVARRCGARGGDIDEVVQDAWIEASSPAAILPRDVPLLVWMASLVQHRFAHLRRDRERRSRLHLVDDAATAAALAPTERNDVVAIARSREVVRLVRAAVDELEPAYREALHLHLFLGLSPSEVAQQLGHNRVVVRVRLFRGLRRLRRLLPDTLALLLVALLARPGRSQVPIWIGGTVAASLAVGVGTAIALADASPLPVTADIATAVTSMPAPLAPGTTPVPTATPARTAAAVPALSILFRDTGGRPLPGVGLALAPTAGSDPRVFTRRTSTADDGTAAFAVLPPGQCTLVSDRGTSTIVAERGEPQFLELRAPAGVDVHGRVVDGTGAAIAGAAIWLATRAADPLSGTEVATTSGDGSFALRGVPLGSLVAARAAGRSRIVATTVPTTGECTLVLADAGGAIRGTVLDARGAPVADALVVAGAGGEGASARLASQIIANVPPPCCVRTDANGAFAIDGLEPGLLPLVVRSADRTPHHSEVAIETGGVVAVTLRLDDGVRVRGQVRDRATGAPLVATVAVRSDHAVAATTFRSSADGWFEFAALPPGPIAILAATADGAVAELPLDLLPGRHEVVVAVESRRTCRGRVVADDGAALAGWELAVPPGPTAAPPEPWWRTDDAGNVELHLDPHAGEPLRHLLARAPGSPIWLAADAWVEGGTDSFALRVPRASIPTARLQLLLRTHDDRVVADASVYLRADDRHHLAVGKTDAHGLIEIAPLPAGSWSFVAVTPHPDLPPIETAPLQVAAGDRRRVQITAEATGRVDWSLHFRDGTAPRAPLVAIMADATGLQRARFTTARGSQVLMPGSYALFATGDDFVIVGDLVFEVQPGGVVHVDRELRRAARRTLSLHALPPECRGGQLSGRFVDAITEATLCRFDADLDDVLLRPLVAFLPVGSVRLEATAANGARVRAALEFRDLVPEHSAQPVSFELVR